MCSDPEVLEVAQVSKVTARLSLEVVDLVVPSVVFLLAFEFDTAVVHLTRVEP